MISQIFSNSLI